MTAQNKKNGPVPDILLSGGVRLPQIGYGMFQLSDKKQCAECVRNAIDAGYRLFDTAAAYQNEDVLGSAAQEKILDGTVRREDLFFETKVWLSDFGGGKTRASVERSLRRLKTDYIDLVLLHQPFGSWKEAWRELEELQREGKVRAVGVSNFSRQKIHELLSFAGIRPAVDQIEMHPFYSEKDLFKDLKAEGIQPQAWGPFCEGLRDIFENPVLVRIGQAHGKSAAQAALRWNIQRGAAVLPKSTVRAHMEENLDVFDFELSRSEMAEISAMDIGHSEIIDFESPATERLLLKWKLTG